MVSQPRYQARAPRLVALVVPLGPAVDGRHRRARRGQHAAGGGGDQRPDARARRTGTRAAKATAMAAITHGSQRGIGVREARETATTPMTASTPPPHRRRAGGGRPTGDEPDGDGRQEATPNTNRQNRPFHSFHRFPVNTSGTSRGAARQREVDDRQQREGGDQDHPEDLGEDHAGDRQRQEGQISAGRISSSLDRGHVRRVSDPASATAGPRNLRANPPAHQDVFQPRPKQNGHRRNTTTIVVMMWQRAVRPKNTAARPGTDGSRNPGSGSPGRGREAKTRKENRPPGSRRCRPVDRSSP